MFFFHEKSNNSQSRKFFHEKINSQSGKFFHKKSLLEWEVYLQKSKTEAVVKHSSDFW